MQNSLSMQKNLTILIYRFELHFLNKYKMHSEVEAYRVCLIPQAECSPYQCIWLVKLINSMLIKRKCVEILINMLTSEK